MILIVGLTGGIGSGKTTVAKMFIDLGIPVFIADEEAKYLMRNSKVIKRKLTALFGEKVYKDGVLNKAFISKKIFSDKELLKQMNAIIHPKVAKRFKRWVSKQKTPYVLSEAAILFENGSYKKYDYIITVTASKADKIERVIKRDASTKEHVMRIMTNQWSDEDKIKRSNYVIHNIELDDTRKQVQEIHNQLLKKNKDFKI